MTNNLRLLEKNIRLGFRKGCMIPEQLALLLIKQKNHNKDLENSNLNILEVQMSQTSYSKYETETANRGQRQPLENKYRISEWAGFQVWKFLQPQG